MHTALCGKSSSVTVRRRSPTASAAVVPQRVGSAHKGSSRERYTRCRLCPAVTGIDASALVFYMHCMSPTAKDLGKTPGENRETPCHHDPHDEVICTNLNRKREGKCDKLSTSRTYPLVLYPSTSVLVAMADHSRGVASRRGMRSGGMQLLRHALWRHAAAQTWHC